jgi:hypothetical protein
VEDGRRSFKGKWRHCTTSDDKDPRSGCVREHERERGREREGERAKMRHCKGDEFEEKIHKTKPNHFNDSCLIILLAYLEL